MIFIGLFIDRSIQLIKVNFHYFYKKKKKTKLEETNVSTDFNHVMMIIILF